MVGYFFKIWKKYLIKFKELQQLADQDDSEVESSDDDWKTEGRKISEELTRGN